MLIPLLLALTCDPKMPPMVFRNRLGHHQGTMTCTQSRKLILRDARGRLEGTFDGRVTRDRLGRLVGTGNQLARLLPA